MSKECSTNCCRASAGNGRPVPIHPRAMEPEKLVELAHQFGRPAKIVDDVPLPWKKRCD